MTDAAIKRNRLFARLLCDEYERRSVFGYSMSFANGAFYVGLGDAPSYLRFLRGERRQHKCYPIAIRALKQIGAA